jgi:dienelactone hydrolase
MRKIVFMMLLLAASLITTAACAVSVQFKSLDIGSDGNPIILTGKLTKPKGEGPFPALVLLHGSGGVKARRDADWVKRLTNWGYVSLQVDSFGPRGVSVSEILKNSFKVPHYTRAKDAHGARHYLSRLPFVDRNRIAVMGWSHGGLSTIVSVIDAYGGDSFKAAIAFYPYCAYSMNWLKAPLDCKGPSGAIQSGSCC